MLDNEIPRGARTRTYRFFEMLPAVLSLAVPLAAIVLSVIDPRWGIAFVLCFIAAALYRAIRGGVDAIRGYRRLRDAEEIDWAALGRATEGAVLRARWEAAEAAEAGNCDERSPLTRPIRLWPGPEADFAALLPALHRRRYARFTERLACDPTLFPLPSETIHAVIVAACNEPYEVIAPSLRSLAESVTERERLVVVFAHEERGGDAMREIAARLEREFAGRFRAFIPVEHPSGLPDEIPGKGGNITFGARRLLAWVDECGIDRERVLVTTLDCDNRVHPQYFESVTYEFVIDPERRRRSFQPISTFVNNIWHAPAPTRLIAAGNTLWNLISTVRPLALRNFASHTQPLGPLVEMDFWSRRTIVEDGHQYWRSYFHFDGWYGVTPIHLPISQDAVLGASLVRTLRAQFKQLCRWAYGASDVAFVGAQMVDRDRRAPLGATLGRFVLLLDSHVSLACIAPMVAFGAWIPLFVAALLGSWGGDASALAAAEGLPDLVGAVQRIAVIGVLITMSLTLLLTPPRPEGVPRRRGVWMLAQWLLLPVTALCYNAASAVVSQGRLLVGAYREDFDVTEKRASVPERVPARQSA